MIYVGADPEFGVLNPAGRAVPAHTWFPPKRDKLLRGGGSIYRDGFMVELNPEPSHCRALLEENVKRLLDAAQERLPAGYTLTSLPTVAIDPTSLVDAPADVGRFGCDSAHNAYTGRDELPKLDGRHRRRYAGGHLHVGVDRMSSSYAWVDDPEMRLLYVRMVDRWAGVPLAYMTASPAQFARRRYYGRAGEMRYQLYGRGYHGIEWRVPGADIWNNNALVSFALGIMRHIAMYFKAYAQAWDPAVETRVANALNTGRGLEALLPTSWKSTSGTVWYTKALLRRMARARVFAEFGLPYAAYDMHCGWTEWCDLFAPGVVGWGEDD